MEKKITLFHGSEKVIEHPVFGAGKKHNDFGLGFYCTESEALAKEWAASAVSTAGAVVSSGTAGAAVPHPASIAAAIRQDRGITFFFIMIFSFVFVLLTPTL